MKNKEAFTLVEVIIVLVLLGIVAGFAVNGYQKSVDRQNTKRMAMEHITITMANKMYQARRGAYWVPTTTAPVGGWDKGTTDKNVISAALGINLNQSNMTYEYSVMNDGSRYFLCTRYQVPNSGIASYCRSYDKNQAVDDVPLKNF